MNDYVNIIHIVFIFSLSCQRWGQMTIWPHLNEPKVGPWPRWPPPLRPPVVFLGVYPGIDPFTWHGPQLGPTQRCRLLPPPGTREPGGGVGATCSHNLEAVGAPPPTLWTVNVAHFYFCLFLHANLGLSQKIVGQIQGVFSFG